MHYKRYNRNTLGESTLMFIWTKDKQLQHFKVDDEIAIAWIR